MGVRGLKTYLERNCPNACYQVDISQLVLSRRMSGKGAEIVVDAQSCFSMWYQGLDWTIGMEIQPLIHRLQSFVLSFQNINADLVFFIGGLTPEEKRKTWLRRRVANMHKMMNVFDLLYQGCSYRDIPVQWDYIPANMTNFVAYVLKYVLNCTVYVTVEECDKELIQYVHENDSFAIFANDTDFVISQLECVVLSADSFNSSQMTTLLYDRDELCKCLEIEKEKLPLLAILAGNDYIDHESLKQFHATLCNWSSNSDFIPYNFLFTSLGNYINRMCSKSYVFTADLENICNDVFSDVTKVNEVVYVYSGYYPKKRPVSPPCYTPWSRVLKTAEELFRKVYLPVSVWGVLSRQVYESSICLEDMRTTNDNNEDPMEQPSATITRALRRRLYGVLLYEIKHSDPTVTEWCGENEQSYQEAVIVKPKYTKANHPGLRALWDQSRSNTHYHRKWNLFLKAVSPKIQNYSAWILLPDDLIVSAATCYYLYKEAEFLKEKELSSVLTTLALYPLDDDGRFETECGGKCDLRAIQISVAFSRTYSLVFALFASCGYPAPLGENTAHIKFNPKLFQWMFQNVNYCACFDDDYDYLCENCDPTRRLELMYNAIRS